MIRTLIVQSETMDQTAIEKVVTGRNECIQLLGIARCVASGVAMIRRYRPELVILDIELIDGSGFEVLESTKDLDFEKIIISEKDRYVIKAALYKVFDYCLKPLDPEELCGSLEKLMFEKRGYSVQRMYDDQVRGGKWMKLTRLAAMVGEELQFLPVNDLVRIHDQGNYRILHYGNGDQVFVTNSLNWLASALVLNDFYKVSFCDVVNLRCVLKDHCKSTLSLKMLDGFEVQVPLRIERSLRAKMRALSS